jgi:uncharacterized protein (DUF305 family)
MALCAWLIPAALFLTAAAASDQQADTAAGNPPIIQPGAPGQSGTVLSASTVHVPTRAPSQADISFMQGMMMHHSQAVEMTDLMGARTRNKALLALGQRISISQTDEIKYMKQWLEDRGQSTSMPGHNMQHMAGMDHSKMKMDAMPMMMPGMLTPEQMQALAKAKGPAFDRLFLTGMIQHHTGALIMVEDLFDTAGAGQDNVLFDFATDIDNTQRAEINIMQGMLKK